MGVFKPRCGLPLSLLNTQGTGSYVTMTIMASFTSLFTIAYRKLSNKNSVMARTEDYKGTFFYLKYVNVTNLRFFQKASYMTLIA